MENQLSITSPDLLVQAQHYAIDIIAADADSLAGQKEPISDFLVAIYLARTIKSAYQILREHVFRVFETGSWQSVPMPETDIRGNPTGGSYFFESFDKWLNEVALQSGLDDTYTSTLRNNVKSLAPLIATNQLITSDGEIITSEDVLGLNRSSFELLASIAREKSEQGDEESLTMLADAVRDAQSLPRAELKEKWQEQGLIGRKIEPLIGHYVTNRDGQMIYVIVPKNFVEEKRLQMMLGKSVDVRPATIEDIENDYFRLDQP